MRTKLSAGLLMFRRRAGVLEFFLAHPGGPFSERKDDGYWTIPKGELEAGEDLLTTAQREFQEETGVIPHGPYLKLDPIQQRGGKWVHAWAFEHDHAGEIQSNTFRMEWPPGSGEMRQYPEVDRAGYFAMPQARLKLKERQVPLLEQLAAMLPP